MAKKEANTNCILCGKPYHLCIICDSTKPDWKRWKTITDTENCYNIYVILNDYNFGVIPGNTALTGLGDDYASRIVLSEKATEETISERANIIAVKAGNENSEKIKVLIDALKSEAVKKYINDNYAGAVVPVVGAA